MAAAAALLTGTFIYANTNVLSADRICHGWVTPDQVSDALGGGWGRVSASEDSPTTCSARLESWLPGQGGELLNLYLGKEAAGFPFKDRAWEVSGTRHVMTGGTHGAYSTGGGWALLPPACSATASDDDSQTVLHAAVTRGDSAGDSAGMGRLLASAAQALTSGPQGCASGTSQTTPTRYLAPTAPDDTDFDKVCGIPGFRLGKVTGPEGQKVQEQTSGSLKDGLYCDLTFEGDEDGPFAQLAVVNDSRFVEPLKNRSFARADCDGRETVFADDMRYREPKEQATTGLPDDASLAKTFSDAAREALHCN
ncbi:hypothetical protein ABZ137_14625 [Streptomyces bobili]|uniref:hypothetical protein n=1 Tax=Streptomyces bobili TaxID=67280 RepID=UPI0033AFE691